MTTLPAPAPALVVARRGVQWSDISTIFLTGMVGGSNRAAACNIAVPLKTQDLATCLARYWNNNTLIDDADYAALLANCKGKTWQRV